MFKSSPQTRSMRVCHRSFYRHMRTSPQCRCLPQEPKSFMSSAFISSVLVCSLIFIKSFVQDRQVFHDVDKILLAEGVLLQLVLLGLEVLGVRLGAAQHLEKIQSWSWDGEKGHLEHVLSEKVVLAAAKPEHTVSVLHSVSHTLRTSSTSVISSMPTIHQSIHPSIHPHLPNTNWQKSGK